MCAGYALPLTGMNNFFYVLSCGCQAGALPVVQPCCSAPLPTCPTQKIPVRTACCEAETLCRAESANASLHLCAVKKGKKAWINEARADEQLGAVLAIGADILLRACDTTAQTCVSDTIRRLVPRKAKC